MGVPAQVSGAVLVLARILEGAYLLRAAIARS
jgi:hypothetical protein